MQSRRITKHGLLHLWVLKLLPCLLREIDNYTANRFRLTAEPAEELLLRRLILYVSSVDDIIFGVVYERRDETR